LCCVLETISVYVAVGCCFVNLSSGYLFSTPLHYGFLSCLKCQLKQLLTYQFSPTQLISNLSQPYLSNRRIGCNTVYKLSMGSKEESSGTIFCFLLLFFLGSRCQASEIEATQIATIKVDASPQLARKIPETLFGIFFEVRL
jgi:hypothetical protein